MAPAPRSGGAADGRRAVTSRPVSPPPPRADVPPAPADPSLLATGSFVDQYVRSAGYEHPRRAGRGPGSRDVPTSAPAAAPAPDETSRRSTDSDSGGRTVAELLAAHAATGRTGGRRRREP